MIINIKHKEDLITLDLRIKQIRYLRNPEKLGVISFINLSNDDVEGYEYLFNEDKPLFKKSLREDLFSFERIKVNLKDLVFI